MASKEKMTGIRLSDTQNAKIRYIADYNHRKINDEFRLIIDEHIRLFESEHGEITIEKDTKEENP
nr:MAG TPA: MNT REPRESSOR MUTANT WITH C-TERMINAL REGULATION [Inoviridae sp.]